MQIIANSIAPIIKNEGLRFEIPTESKIMAAKPDRCVRVHSPTLARSVGENARAREIPPYLKNRIRPLIAMATADNPAAHEKARLR